MAESNFDLRISNDYVPLVHDDQNILEVNRLKKYFPIKDGI